MRYWLVPLLATMLGLLPLLLGAQTPAYADQLFKQRKFPAAILEYERFLYHEARSQEDSLYAQKQIMKSFYRAGMDEMLSEYGRESGLIERDREFTTRFLALSELRQGRYEVARLIPNREDGANALLLKGITELYLNRPDEAMACFGDLPSPGSGSVIYNKELLLSYCDRLKALPGRSAFLAGTLALIPGAGYAYNGKWQTALSSLLLQGAFFASAWELRRHQLPISSAMVALMGTAYYLGSIYGSASEAMRYNQEQRKKYLDSNLASWINCLEQE